MNRLFSVYQNRESNPNLCTLFSPSDKYGIKWYIVSSIYFIVAAAVVFFKKRIRAHILNTKLVKQGKLTNKKGTDYSQHTQRIKLTNRVARLDRGCLPMAYVSW